MAMTIADALRFLRDGGVDPASEARNPDASWRDLMDDFDRGGYTPDFSYQEYCAALAAIAEARGN